MTDEGRLKMLSRIVERKVRLAFEDPAVRADFEEWYEERYGKKYEWEQNFGKRI